MTTKHIDRIAPDKDGITQCQPNAECAPLWARMAAVSSIDEAKAALLACVRIQSRDHDPRLAPRLARKHDEKWGSR